jgi:hypothetical protein
VNTNLIKWVYALNDPYIQAVLAGEAQRFELKLEKKMAILVISSQIIFPILILMAQLKVFQFNRVK